MCSYPGISLDEGFLSWGSGFQMPAYAWAAGVTETGALRLMARYV